MPQSWLSRTPSRASSGAFTVEIPVGSSSSFSSSSMRSLGTVLASSWANSLNEHLVRGLSSARIQISVFALGTIAMTRTKRRGVLLKHARVDALLQLRYSGAQLDLYSMGAVVLQRLRDERRECADVDAVASGVGIMRLGKLCRK